MSTFYTEPTTGTRIATDTIGSDRYQIMKMDLGALGATLPLSGSLLDDSQLGAGLLTFRVGAMQHVYNATTDLWTRVRSANNLTDNFGGGTVPGAIIGAKNAAGNFDLLREIDAASGTTGRGVLAVAPMGSNAGVFQPFQVDSNNNLKTSVTGSVQGPIDDGLTAAGFPVQMGGIDDSGLIRSLLTDILGTISVRDDRVRKLLEALVVAQFSKEEGEIPGSWEVLLKNDLKTIAFGDTPSPMSAYSRAEPISNVHGVPFNLGGHPDLVTFRVNYTTAQTDTAMITPNANQKIIVTSVMATLDKSASVTVSVRIGPGTTTTPTGLGVVASHPGIDPGGGFVKGSGGAIIGVGSLGDPLRITSSVATGGSIDIVINYFLIEA